MKKLMFIMLLAFAACSGVERTTGQVLDNANDAIKIGEKKIWYPSGGQSSSAEQR